MQEDPISLTGALLLVLRKRLPAWEAWPTTVTDTLALVGARKSQAYELCGRIEELLPTVLGRPGRPAKRSAGPERDPARAVGDAVTDHLSRTLFGAGERRTYTDEFRRFVVGLADPGQLGEGLSTAELARVTRVPLGTLKDWLRPPATATEKPDPMSQTRRPGRHLHLRPVREEAGPSASSGPAPIAASAEQADHPSDAPAGGPEHSDGLAETSFEQIILNSHVCLIVEQWVRWVRWEKGPFDAFCEMLRTEHRIPYQNTHIGNILQSAGLRHRRRRVPVEAPWSSDTFRRLFPGAQWLGDGTSIAVHWEDQVFVFNVEAILDVGSNAVLGFKATDCEDEQALLQAFAAALETTGGNPPLSLGLDNRPSNHSEGVVAAIEATGTKVLAATPGRGQAKAPLEGAFGLFRQALPALVLTGKTAREIARCALILILLAWFRGRNGRPRERFAGLNPAEFYLWAQANLTPEQVQEAREWFAELQRRQERFRRTRDARRDPVRIQLLIQGLVELGIPDENGRLAIALACYSRDAIIRGLATFAAKKKMGTLPADADHGRYLGGIIRQLDIRLELEQLSEFLLAQRIRARDVTLAPLTEAAEKLRAELSPEALPQALADRALDAIFTIDFQFWGKAAADALHALSLPARIATYRSLSRRIVASFKTDRRRREDLVDLLSQSTALAA